MPRKSKLESLEQTHGKVETYKPTTLDQIWGDDGHSKYNTMDEQVYLKSLAEMTKSDLHNHAVRIGVVPIEDRERLLKRLLHEFRLHVSSYRFPADAQQQPKQKITPEVAKILAEGR